MSDLALDDQREKWPRLSKTLRFENHPAACKSCGRGDATEEEVELDRWLECDDNDKREGPIIVLCRKCSDRIIEKHPRLYHRLEENAPSPGTHTGPGMCEQCKHRNGLVCKSPRARMNGGEGIGFLQGAPTRGFIDGSKYSGPFTAWPRPTGCQGFEQLIKIPNLSPTAK